MKTIATVLTDGGYLRISKILCNFVVHFQVHRTTKSLLFNHLNHFKYGQ